MNNEWDDHEFYQTVYDRDGNPQRVLKERITKSKKSSGFTVYDSSHGHCGLCGSLSCRGGCFK